MSRTNNVRGPTSALTEFLRESGITHAFVARRARTRQAQAENGQPPQAPEAGPSNANADADVEMADATTSSPARRNNAEDDNAIDSDNMDEPESPQPAKNKRKLGKKALEKLKASQKAKAKKRGDVDSDDDSDDDEYTALSKSLKANAATPSVRPPVGTLEVCTKCEKEFSVTRYTVAAVPPPGFLCHTCAKKAGLDPFKKPAAPRKRKMPEDKRKVTSFEEKQFSSLASLCIKIISDSIDDVEALGDIGAVNLHEIGRVLAKNRCLTMSNCSLLYDMNNTKLELYDVTKLTPDAFCAMASLNPGLESLRLDLCGRVDDIAIKHWAKRFPALTRLELYGPFLVRTEGWMAFFDSHPQLTGFLITQSPRFDLACMESLARNCKGLTELRLAGIGKMGDEFLPYIASFKELRSLDLSSSPGLAADAVVELLSQVGPKLTHLNLSNAQLLDDIFINDGLLPHIHSLSSLVLDELPEITDEAVANYFQNTGNPPMKYISFRRCPLLADDALENLVAHSSEALTDLNINGWKNTSEDALKEIAKLKHLKELDIAWCRQADDFVIKEIIDGCGEIVSISCFGCNRLTINCPRRGGVSIRGVEAHMA